MHGEFDAEEVKSELNSRINELVNLRSTGSSRKVFLVTKCWHDTLLNWLRGESQTPPGIINNSPLLASNGELDIKKKYKIDFMVVEATIWSKLVETFGCNVIITRRLSIHPTTCCTVVILVPVVLEMMTTKGPKIKTCSADWEVGQIRRPLCAALKFIYSENTFVSYETNDVIPDIMPIGEYAAMYGTKIRLVEKSMLESLSRNANSKLKFNLTMPHLTFQIDDGSEIPTSKANEEKHANSIYTQKDPRPLGLVNHGNTCYLNASLQCLVRITPLYQYLTGPGLNLSINRNNPNGTGGQFALEFARFLDSMSSPSNSSRDPEKLRKALISKYKYFNNYKEHDALEVTCALLTGLHEDLCKFRYDAVNHLMTPRSKQYKEINRNAPSSVIQELFQGIIETKTICPNCQECDLVEDPFVFISVPVIKNPVSPSKMFNSPTSTPNRILNFKTTNDTIDLFTLINNFLNPGVLDEFNKWKCPKCNINVRAVQRMSFKLVARILIIHLKRFEVYNGHYKKIETNVSYPSKFDISEIAPNCSGVYKLIGVINHTGTLTSGHYTALSIDPISGKWYSFNDTNVSVVSPNAINSPKAYMLFYVRI